MGVRYEHNWFTLTTYLIAHHSIANIPNQTTEIICILWIVNETLNIPLLSQQLEPLENAFQFPANTFSSGMNLSHGRSKLTAPTSPSFFLPYDHLQEWVYRVRQKGP